MISDVRQTLLTTRPRVLSTVGISLLFAWIGVAYGQNPAPSIAVAAASDLQSVFSALQTGFERDTGTTVSVTFGSSGSFFAQIQNGAPFDVFMSADVDYPKQLVSHGLAEANSEYQYAIGRVVLWTRRDSGIDVTRGLSILQDARVRHVAIANPSLAPYGRAAVAALRQQGLYDAVQPKLVFGDNISQTAQLVESGNATVGILSRSLALGPALAATGTFFEIPASAYPPIAQAVVVLRTARNKDGARAFVEYLKRPETRLLLQRSGLESAQRNK